MADAAVTLSATTLSINAGTRPLVMDLSFEARGGEFIAILGCNGAGKSLSLLTLAGLLQPQKGHVSLNGEPVAALPRRQVARSIGLLLQDLENGTRLTVFENTLINRYPHGSFWNNETAMDSELVYSALQEVGLSAFAQRYLPDLSGGEQRRAAIAALLTQQPEIYLLDEPTNHLDPQHQQLVLRLFRQKAAAGKLVIATLHDPTLAAQFADRAILLHGDGHWESGAVNEVITTDALNKLYRCSFLETCVENRRVFVSA
jgi:iron complex transport system ATP-binding protein